MHCPMTIPAVSDVDRIAALSDPVQRNRQITQCYHDLSNALCSALGTSANWCSFATWASRQAGSTIRGEDLSRALAQRMAHFDVDVRDIVLRGPATRRAAAAVARGNLKVFAEIGREFARFLAEFPDTTARTPERIRDFVATLRPGPPPDGQQHLQNAFEAYALAMDTTDANVRAQLLCYANMLVGFHEQTRLQPEIREALDAARVEIEKLRKDLLKCLLPRWWQRLRRFIARLFRIKLVVDVALDDMVAQIADEIREIITAELMTLELPTGVLRLGHDLNDDFPSSLRQIAHAPLAAFLGQTELPRRTALDERDWSDFPYRMHYITRLFRAYQERTELLRAPFA